MAHALAFWLSEEGRGASLDCREKNSSQLEHFTASVNRDLSQAAAALLAPCQQQQTGQKTPEQQLLPLSALRNDLPRLFYRPDEGIAGGLPLPKWSSDACECQQTPQTTEEAPEPCMHPPEFFGRHVVLKGFSSQPGVAERDGEQ